MTPVDIPFSSAHPSITDPVPINSRPSRRQDFHIAIICALSLEYDAAILLVDEFWDLDHARPYGRTSGDTNTYRNGRIGMHNVVLMLLPNMGKAAVAGSAASLRTSYPSLKLAFLVGVCGGVPILGTHEALLGDVIIGEAIVQYDFGRRYPDEFIPKETSEVTISAQNKDIRSLLAYFKSNTGKDELRRSTANYLKALQDAAIMKHYQCDYRYPGFPEDKLFAAMYRHKHREKSSCDLCCGEIEEFCDEAAQASCAKLGCDENELVPRQRLERKRHLRWEEAQCPEIFIGRVASADTVMKSGHHRDHIAKRDGIIAFEMEGAGLRDEAPCIVVKGICDYADSHKNKIWQPFAAATAAAAVKAMLGRYTLTDHLELSTRSTTFGQQDHSPPSSLEMARLGTKKSSSTSAYRQSNGAQVLQDAISDFQRALTDNQRHELQNIRAIPDADAVLIFTAQLDSLNRNRKGRSIASRLHSVLQSVRDFSAALETFALTHRGIAPLLWESVKLTMLVAVKSVSYYEDLSKLFMDLGGFCPRWTEYQTLYSSSTQLQKALYNFYASLVRCCKRVVETAQRPWSGYFFDSRWESSEREFKRDADDIKRCGIDIKEALSLAKAQADLQNRQLQSREREEASKGGKLKGLFSRKSNRPSDERRTKEQRQQLLDSLSIHDYLTPLKQSRRKRHSGTLEWLFQTHEFDRWFNSTDSPLLWCSGKIGSGKTILAGSVIDKLLTEKRGSDVFISFFFIRFDDSHSLNAEVILRSIVRQALNQSGLSEEIEVLLEKMQLSLSSGPEELLELLQKITAAFKAFYIVIDAVDECGKQDRDDLLQCLSSLATIGSNTKLFLTSRDSISREIQKRFPTLDRLAMNCSLAQSDIAAYVKGIVQEKLQSEELIVEDSGLIEEIKLALIGGADGMFLWVAFQVDELCLQHCDDDIRKAIRNLPKGLEETFDRAVSRIVSRGNEDIAKQVFRWVAAAREPLSLNQLREVIFIEVGQQYSKAERRSNGIDHISSWCENLVHIDEELKTVQFAHQAVRQFLLKKSPEARNSQFYLEVEDADHYIGEICVTYLNFNDFKTTLARRPRPLPPMPPAAIATTALGHKWKVADSVLIGKFNLKTRTGTAAADAVEGLATFQRNDKREAEERLQAGHPFLTYASTHWIFHTANFQKGKSKTWNLWGKTILQGHDLAEKPWGEGSFSASSSLILKWSQKVHHYALIRLISLSGMLSATDRKQIMQNAASEGDITLLDVVLEGEKQGYEMDRACLAAAQGGHLDIVERLLAAGANVNAALQAAIRGGHLDIVKRLLAAGAQVNVSAGLIGQTALQAAAQGGHLDIVERLLAAGADVNAAPAQYDGQTALQVAAQDGHLDIIERLLAAGADVNATPAEYNGRTALQAAAQGGHLDIVERLLAAGADVNATPAEYNGQTALQAAAQGGHLDIIERLLAAGADVNAAPAQYDGRTALQAAAQGGYLDVIERLLAAGAGVNAVPAKWDGQTALQAAAQGGHLDIVERLLAAGADVNAAPAEYNGQTALQAAAQDSHLNIVERLLAAGADVNATPAEYNGRTALQAAAQGGHLDID